jgi:hypothetical protein
MQAYISYTGGVCYSFETSLSRDKSFTATRAANEIYSKESNLGIQKKI